MLPLPPIIDELADELIGSAGVEAVVLGGSRAIGRDTPSSDWDIGVYYRGVPDLTALSRHGEVHEPGRWGRIMNGGSWLDIDGVRVDVLLRDIDVVEHWTAEARQGRFDIDGLLGYVAGIPTYSLTAEASVACVLRGRFDVDARFPAELAAVGPGRWRFNRDFSLHHAGMHAARGNAVLALGQAVRATIEEAHARCCERRVWVLNEKHLLEAAGMAEISAAITAIGATTDLAAALANLRSALGDR